MEQLTSKDLSNREKEPKQPTRKLSKTPTTFHVKLTDEQKLAKAVALDSRVTFFTGKPGTSKTLLTCQIALDLLIRGVVGKIIVTRPTVTVGKDIGYLPGEAFSFEEGKMAPYMAPILQAMFKLRDKKDILKFIEEDKIQIVPIQFVRGLNFDDCVVLIDESQNLLAEELKAIVTRLCVGAKMLFTSDVAQVDLLDKSTSSGRLVSKIAKLPGVGLFELTEQFRDPLAILIMELIDEEVKQEKLKIAA